MNHIDIYEGRIERIKDHFRRNRNKYLAGAAAATAAGLGGFAARRYWKPGDAQASVATPQAPPASTQTSNTLVSASKPKAEPQTVPTITSMKKATRLSPREEANVEYKKKVDVVLAGKSDAPF